MIDLDGFHVLDGFAPHPCAIWAPDGRWVAFGGGGEVWVVDTQTGAIRRLPDLRPSDLEWRPGTDQLAIAGDMGPNRAAPTVSTPVIVYSVSTGELRQLGSVEAAHLTWSPDGSTLAYQGGEDDASTLRLVDADGADERVLVANPGEANHGIGPVWSPTGDRIAYQRLIGGGERHEVVLVRVADETETVIAPPATDGPDGPTRWYPYYVTWSPDGTTLLYSAWSQVAPSEPTSPTGLIAVPADTPTDVTVLTDTVHGHRRLQPPVGGDPDVGPATGVIGITGPRDPSNPGGTLTKNWKWRAIAVGAAAVLALGACAGDDDDDASASDTGTEAEEPAVEQDVVAAFCDAIAEVGYALSIGEGYEGIDSSLVAAEDVAPDEIRADVTTMAEENRAQVATGPPPEEQPPVIPSDDFFAAATSVGDYMADNCGYQVIDVAATDFAFDGIPADADAGKTLIRITNDGTEYHEVVLQRVQQGETRSVDEILALPEEGGGLLEYLGYAFAPPGLGSWTVVDLSAGRHVAMCFVPIGATTTEALQSGQFDDAAQLHAMQGMFTEMQVS